MDLHLLQREVAAIIGVNAATIQNWEAGSDRMALDKWPGIIRFLGYDPRPPAHTIGEKFRHHRQAQGLSAAKVARILVVDSATITKWELKDDRRHNHLSVPRIIQFLGYNSLPEPESVGQYIRQVRFCLGLKQTELTARLHLAKDTVSEWELDKRKPTPAQLAQIEALSAALEAPLQMFCPAHLRAECVKAVRPDRRRRPRSTYPSELKTLGDHIRARRLDLGLSQATLAKRFGVNRNVVTAWESNRQDPMLALMPKLLKFLGHKLPPQDEALEERLRSKRRELGLTQKALGKLLAVSHKTVVN